MPEPVRFRTAKPADLPRLGAIHLAAYPDDRSAAAHERGLRGPGFGDLADLVVAEVGRRIVAHGFLFGLRAGFGGRLVPVGGIGSVAVAPEARCQGIGSALMNELHRRADRRGDAVTMLHPFRRGFYERFGYAPVSSSKRLEIAPRSVPRSWRGAVREASGRDRKLLRELHARAVVRGSGVTSRPPSRWNQLLSHERLTILVCDGGYVAFEISSDVLEVRELVAEDPRSRRTLVAAVGAMQDQVRSIILHVAENDPLERALADPDVREDDVAGSIVLGGMVRIVDVARALEARGWTEDARFDVEIDAERLGVRIRKGRASVVEPGGAPTLRTTRAGLAAVLYGALDLDDAITLGVVHAEGLDARIFRIPPVLPLDPF
jgi:predicted acetyltransferase